MKILNYCLAVLAALFIFSGCNKDEDGGAAEIKLDFSISPVDGVVSFPGEKTSDYAPVTPLTVTVTNSGKKATDKVTIVLDGQDANRFTLSKGSIANIDGGKNDNFTVAPVQGLAEGTYKTTVYVSAKGIPAQSFGVFFAISPDIYKLEITSPATKLEFGLNEPIDLTGLVVTVTNSEGAKFPLQNLESYVTYNFSSVSEINDDDEPLKDKEVSISANGGFVKYDVSVLPLRHRILRASGKTETIIVYATETTDASIPVNAGNTNISLTTRSGSTDEVVLRKATTGSYIFNVNGNGGNISLTLDGYVTLKGWATQAYGGSDDRNNSSQLVLIQHGATFEMKGHSKLTGNCNAVALADGSGTSVIAAGFYIAGENTKVIITGNAEVSNNWVVNTGRNGGVTYGGAFYIGSASTGSEVRLRENGKIINNVSINEGGNAYGGVAAGEGGVVYIEGGEVSGNSARNMTINGTSGGGFAGGGAFQIVNPAFRVVVSGGVMKDNYLIFMKAGRGSAFNVGHANGLTLSGAANIVPGGAVEAPGSDGRYKDPGNAISLTDNGASVLSFYIDGALSTTSVMNIDLQSQGTLNLDAEPVVMRKFNDGTPLFFDGDAPVSKFALRNVVRYSTGTVSSITPLTDYTLNTDGKVVKK